MVKHAILKTYGIRSSDLSKPNTVDLKIASWTVFFFSHWTAWLTLAGARGMLSRPRIMPWSVHMGTCERNALWMWPLNILHHGG